MDVVANGRFLSDLAQVQLRGGHLTLVDAEPLGGCNERFAELTLDVIEHLLAKGYAIVSEEGIELGGGDYHSRPLVMSAPDTYNWYGVKRLTGTIGLRECRT